MFVKFTIYYVISSTFNYHSIYRFILFTASSLPTEEPSAFIKPNDTQSR